jgi:hypothetical protein
MKKLLLYFLISVLFACSSVNKAGKTANSYIRIEADTMTYLEDNLFVGCPISKGANNTMAYIEGLQTFLKGIMSHERMGTVRYHAKNAKLFNAELVDEKSLFLLNFKPNSEAREITLFQAIYFFKKEEDKNATFQLIVKALEEGLGLTPIRNYDIEMKPYKKYYLHDGSGINLKYSSSGSDSHIINILWVENAKN